MPDVYETIDLAAILGYAGRVRNGVLTATPMARSASQDTKFLECKNGKWRVSVAVPRPLQARLGTRLKRPLKTDSLAVANRLKWGVVAEFRAMIDEAVSGSPTDPLVVEAMELASARARSRDPEALELLDEGILMRAEELRGDPVQEEEDYGGGPLYLYDPDRERRAGEFLKLARGEEIPVALYHDDYLKQSTTKRRTKGDDERALRFLEAWCAREKVEQTLQAITRKRAARFMDDLGEIAGGQSPVTLNKYVSRLRRYWAWLVKREHVEANVWLGLNIPVPDTPYDEKERPFTDEELLRLLNGPATQAMADVMRIGALTGARLDVIVDLKAKDAADGIFTFKPQKKEDKPRSIPVHSDLAEIVARRLKGRGPEDDLFPEWPEPKSVNSERERSFKTSNDFTAYRRSVGVEEMVAGKRRSLVNFHSFRRWFITKAEQADQPESIIAVVVGHKRPGMTLGRYSAGPLMEQARRCVEAVRLP